MDLDLGLYSTEEIIPNFPSLSNIVFVFVYCPTQLLPPGLTKQLKVGPARTSPDQEHTLGPGRIVAYRHVHAYEIVTLDRSIKWMFFFLMQ